MPSRKLRLPRWFTNKNKGELVESIFVMKAQSFGLEVSKPFGENHAFDFHVQSRRLGAFRVQVKSAWMHVPRGPYIVNLKHRWRNRQSGYDVVAIYLVRLDFWYIIPASAINHQYLRLYPHSTNPRAKYEPYREGWRTLTGDVHDDTRRIGLEIHAKAE
jgi:PD-(D/E)XK endonuclease